MLWFFKIGEADAPRMDGQEFYLGLFSTPQLALNWRRHVAGQPGFRDWPDGFRIVARRLNHTSWADGFQESTDPAAEVKRVYGDQFL